MPKRVRSSSEELVYNGNTNNNTDGGIRTRGSDRLRDAETNRRLSGSSQRSSEAAENRYSTRLRRSSYQQRDEDDEDEESEEFDEGDDGNTREEHDDNDIDEDEEEEEDDNGRRGRRNRQGARGNRNDGSQQAISKLLNESSGRITRSKLNELTGNDRNDGNDARHSRMRRSYSSEQTSTLKFYRLPGNHSNDIRDLNESNLGPRRRTSTRRESHEPSERSERVLRSSSRRGQESSDDQLEDTENDENEEDEEDEEEAENDNGRKYSLRNRDTTRRDISVLNIKTLGGDAGGLSKSSSGNTTRRRTYVDPQPRLYLGGRIPNFAAKAKYHRSNSRSHRQHRRGPQDRRHFDSSSDSSSTSSSPARDRGSGRRGASDDDMIRSKPRRHVGSDDEDSQFMKYEQRRLDQERESIQPIQIDSLAVGGSVIDKASKRDLLRADVAPVAVDPSLGFDSVGGLDSHIAALKEMVVLPLLYPDVFSRFDTQPPRGVLFVGPPGTGKTLTARALANSISATASKGGRKIAFFMRKGADCLSKWVGEGERQLRLLFEQAKRHQPSIIFFDEIDGLAPVRSVKQDQIHASIVSTLLALMDGLDARGQVVVIGATNRPDAIDAALRRAGRFDRELVFPLPNASARRAIIDIHTAKWDPPVSSSMKDWIVHRTRGYCGADIKAFCAEAALISLRRAYPQVYESDCRLELDPSKLSLTQGDFAAALNKVVASSSRSVNLIARPLNDALQPLLQEQVVSIRNLLAVVFAAGVSAVQRDTRSILSGRATRSQLLEIREDSEEWIASLVDSYSAGESSGQAPTTSQLHHESWLWDFNSISCQPRVVISSHQGMGHEDLAAATLHFLESLPSYSLDVPSLIADMQAVSVEHALVLRIQDALRTAPSVIYFPDLLSWWKGASESLRSTLMAVMQTFPPSCPVLWLTTLMVPDGIDLSSINSSTIAEIGDERLTEVLAWLGGTPGQDSLPVRTTVLLSSPTALQRREYFASTFNTLPSLPSRIYTARLQILTARANRLQVCSTTSNTPQGISAATEGNAPAKRKAEAKDYSYVFSDRNQQCLREQRTFFRAALAELLKENKFKVFSRPVDAETVPDYYDIITSPMDLETMRMKVDAHLYPTLNHFLRDIDQIVFNAKAYNPMTREDHRGRYIVHSAHGMLDLIESHAYHFKKEVGYDLFSECIDVARRQQVDPPLPPPAIDDVMPAINKPFYAEVLAVHERVKEEQGDQHPTAILNASREIDAAESQPTNKKSGTGQSSVNRSWNITENDSSTPAPAKIDHDSDRRVGTRSTRSQSSATQLTMEELSSQIDFLQSRRKRQRMAPSEVAETVATVASESGSLAMHSSTAATTTLPTDDNDNGGSLEVNPVEPESGVADGAAVLTQEDIESCPLMRNLLLSIDATKVDKEAGVLNRILEKLVQVTENWTIAGLTSIMTGINRVCRALQYHGEWGRCVRELDLLVAQAREDFYHHRQ